MGKDLAEAFSAARRVFEEIDDALGYRLSQVMWEGPEDLLTRTDNAQPAILAHTAAVWAVTGPQLAPLVAGAAGHSLGEYSAYVMAGTLTPAEGARLVRRRGELMNEAGAARPGTMAAVMGLEADRVAAVCREASDSTATVVAANLNAPDQTVISGDPAAVARASELLKAAGARRVIPLKVSGAFHSNLMAPAGEGLAAALDEARMADPIFPVVANASATPIRDAATARVQLKAQLTSPVRWVECVSALAGLAAGPARFVEVGPGAVLSGLARRVVNGSQCITLGTADEMRAFLEAA
jgi:[acyl-carrier-protein] S-malonyltransferase